MRIAIIVLFLAGWARASLIITDFPDIQFRRIEEIRYSTQQLGSAKDEFLPQVRQGVVRCAEVGNVIRLESPGLINAMALEFACWDSLEQASNYEDWPPPRPTVSDPWQVRLTVRLRDAKTYRLLGSTSFDYNANMFPWNNYEWISVSGLSWVTTDPLVLLTTQFEDLTGRYTGYLGPRLTSSPWSGSSTGLMLAGWGDENNLTWGKFDAPMYMSAELSYLRGETLLHEPEGLFLLIPPVGWVLYALCRRRPGTMVWFVLAMGIFCLGVTQAQAMEPVHRDSVESSPSMVTVPEPPVVLLLIPVAWLLCRRPKRKGPAE